MGYPMRPLRWVSKSHDKLATALRALGHKVRSSTIPKLLEELKYCRHSNRKTKEAGKHPDRDAQFEYINAKVEAFQAAGEPVISIDAKKKELLGKFKYAVATMGRRAYRSRSTLTISRTRSWARSSLTGSTTSTPISAISASESTTTAGVRRQKGGFICVHCNSRSACADPLHSCRFPRPAVRFEACGASPIRRSSSI